MKNLIATIIGLTIVTAANPGMAYVAEVVTSIPVETDTDDAQLKAALEGAIKDVVGHAIAFTPTMVVLEKARCRGPERSRAALRGRGR